MQYLGAISKHRKISVRFQDKPFNITVIQVYAPTTNAEEAEVEWFCEDLHNFLDLTPRNDVLLTIGDRNAKVGSKELPGVTGKFNLGLQNEAGQRLREFCQENTLVMANTLFQNTRDNSTYGCHQMGNTKIRLIMLFEAEDGVTLYTYQKHDGEMIVTQIMNSLLQNSDLNRKN